MTYTTNYQLPQWVKSDRIMMDDFNDANQKLDTALKNLADQDGVLETALAAKGNCRIELKTYTGTGSSGSASPTRVTFSAVPTAYVIFGYRGIAVGRGGASTASVGATSGTGSSVSSLACTWSGSRLSFYANNAYFQLNMENQTYCVLAFYLLEE